MAATAVSDTTQPILDTTQGTQIVRGHINLSGNYGGGATNGDTLSFGIFPVQSNQVPKAVFIYEQPAAGTAPTGYQFLYGAGTTNANGVLIVLTSSGTAGNPATQITQGAAYPAGLVTAATAGTLKFEAVFPLGM